MNINFSGYRENILTFECDEHVFAGGWVKMLSSGKVTCCKAGENFIGVAVAVRDGYAAVQLDGYTEAQKNGEINVGYNKLVAAPSGVQFAESGIDRLVIYSSFDTVGFIL